MPTPESRFARALAEYLSRHSQQALVASAEVNRAVISHITTGRRQPAQNAAKAIIRGIPEAAERRALLKEWLEDNIPDNCHDLLLILEADPSLTPTVGQHPTPTEKERAIAWLMHQLDTNLHAVQAVLDLYRAAGSPTTPPRITQPITPINYRDTLTTDPATHQNHRLNEDPQL